LARSSQKVTELDGRGIESRSRMGADHGIGSFGGAELRTRTPEPTNAPKRINRLRVPPFEKKPSEYDVSNCSERCDGGR
jgi:hypothetical protein